MKRTHKGRRKPELNNTNVKQITRQMMHAAFEEVMSSDLGGIPSIAVLNIIDMVDEFLDANEHALSPKMRRCLKESMDMWGDDTRFLASGSFDHLIGIILEDESIVVINTGDGCLSHGTGVVDGASIVCFPFQRFHFPGGFDRLLFKQHVEALTRLHEKYEDENARDHLQGVSVRRGDDTVEVFTTAVFYEGLLTHMPGFQGCSTLEYTYPIQTSGSCSYRGCYLLTYFLWVDRHHGRPEEFHDFDALFRQYWESGILHNLGAQLRSPRGIQWLHAARDLAEFAALRRDAPQAKALVDSVEAKIVEKRKWLLMNSTLDTVPVTVTVQGVQDRGDTVTPSTRRAVTGEWAFRDLRTTLDAGDDFTNADTRAILRDHLERFDACATPPSAAVVGDVMKIFRDEPVYLAALILILGRHALRVPAKDIPEDDAQYVKAFSVQPLFRPRGQCGPVRRILEAFYTQRRPFRWKGERNGTTIAFLPWWKDSAIAPELRDLYVDLHVCIVQPHFERHDTTITMTDGETYEYVDVYASNTSILDTIRRLAVAKRETHGLVSANVGCWYPWDGVETEDPADRYTMGSENLLFRDKLEIEHITDVAKEYDIPTRARTLADLYVAQLVHPDAEFDESVDPRATRTVFREWQYHACFSHISQNIKRVTRRVREALPERLRQQYFDGSSNLRLAAVSDGVYRAVDYPGFSFDTTGAVLKTHRVVNGCTYTHVLTSENKLHGLWVFWQGQHGHVVGEPIRDRDKPTGINYYVSIAGDRLYRLNVDWPAHLDDCSIRVFSSPEVLVVRVNKAFLQTLGKLKLGPPLLGTLDSTLSWYNAEDKTVSFEQYVEPHVSLTFHTESKECIVNSIYRVIVDADHPLWTWCDGNESMVPFRSGSREGILLLTTKGSSDVDRDMRGNDAEEWMVRQPPVIESRVDALYSIYAHSTDKDVLYPPDGVVARALWNALCLSNNARRLLCLRPIVDFWCKEDTLPLPMSAMWIVLTRDPGEYQRLLGMSGPYAHLAYQKDIDDKKTRVTVTYTALPAVYPYTFYDKERARGKVRLPDHLWAFLGTPRRPVLVSIEAPVPPAFPVPDRRELMFPLRVRFSARGLNRDDLNHALDIRALFPEQERAIETIVSQITHGGPLACKEYIMGFGKSKVITPYVLALLWQETEVETMWLVTTPELVDQSTSSLASTLGAWMGFPITSNIVIMADTTVKHNAVKHAQLFLRPGPDVILFDEVDWMSNPLTSEFNIPSERAQLPLDMLGRVRFWSRVLSLYVSMPVDPTRQGDGLHPYVYRIEDARAMARDLVWQLPDEITRGHDALSSLLPLVLTQRKDMDFGLVIDDDDDGEKFLAFPFDREVPLKGSTFTSTDLTIAYTVYCRVVGRVRGAFGVTLPDVQKWQKVVGTEHRATGHADSPFLRRWIDVMGEFPIDGRVHQAHVDELNGAPQRVLLFLEHFLCGVVFPLFLKVYKSQVQCTFTDLATGYFRSKKVGFTGTAYMFDMLDDLSDPRYRLQGIEANDLDRQKIHTVLSTPRDIVQWTGGVHDLTTSSNVVAVIDVGAFFHGTDMHALASSISVHRPVLYWHKSVSFLSTYGRRGTRYPIANGVVPSGVLVLFDQSHTTGTDLNLDPRGHALVTFNETTTYRDLSQGVYRMRKIASGQTFSYVTVRPMDARAVVELALHNARVVDARRQPKGAMHCYKTFLKFRDNSWTVSTTDPPVGSDCPRAIRAALTSGEPSVDIGITVEHEQEREMERDVQSRGFDGTLTIPYDGIRDTGRWAWLTPWRKQDLNAGGTRALLSTIPACALVDAIGDHKVLTIPRYGVPVDGEECVAMVHEDNEKVFLVHPHMAWYITRHAPRWRILLDSPDPIVRLHLRRRLDTKETVAIARTLVTHSSTLKAEDLLTENDETLVDSYVLRIAVGDLRGLARHEYMDSGLDLSDIFRVPPPIPREQNPQIIEYYHRARERMG
jgi:hypothetical protein